MTAHILACTGTKREAATLARPGFVVILGGGDSAALRAKLEAAVPRATGVLSFGFAGALAEDLAIGDWIVADRVTGAVEARCDADWSATLVECLGARTGPVHADGRLVDSIADKRTLRATGALAVDMESHIAAAVSAKHGLPFAIARCISDGARHVLPPAIGVAMRPDGGVDGLAMLRSLATKPGQVPDLARTVSGILKAMRVLKRGAQQIPIGRIITTHYVAG